MNSCKNNTVKMLEIPSKVTNRKFIRMPNEKKVVDSDDVWNRCGKWILKNTTRSIDWIDETWIKLQTLLDKGYLLMIIASTAMPSDNPGDLGTILCFTRPGEEEIERAAKEIRKIVSYESTLYYRKNRMTVNEIDHRYGHSIITSYMHSPKGFFYKRIPAHHWILVNGEEIEKERKKSLMHKWNIANFEDQVGYLHLLYNGSCKTISCITEHINKERLPFNTWFAITCNFEEVGNTVSEADRLWIVGKKLINEDIIYSLSVKNNSSVAEFHFFNLEKLDIQSFIKLCTRIQEEAQVFRFVYAKIGQIYYRYSPEREYERVPSKFNEV